MRSRPGMRHETDLCISTEPRGLTASQSRPANILTTAAVPGRSAALDVCVASSITAAARRDAAQAAFDRKLAHYTRKLRQQNIHYRPLVWTAGARGSWNGAGSGYLAGCSSMPLPQGRGISILNAGPSDSDHHLWVRSTSCRAKSGQWNGKSAVASRSRKR